MPIPALAARNRLLAALGAWAARYRRLIVWGMLAALLAVDASIFSPISLGVLYFVPLLLTAATQPLWEGMLMACCCGLGRVLFGPVGDPLGLQQVTVRLPEHAQVVVNGLIAFAGYLVAVLLATRLGAQGRVIRRMGAEVETDPLTGLGNRRAIDRLLLDLERRVRPVSVLFIDIDHFKRVNDTRGHDAGDRVLRDLAGRIRRQVRDGDIAARWGGEEFVVLLPADDARSARAVAERLWQSVRREPFEVAGERIAVTVSIGVANGNASNELLAAADRRLNAAKQAGRDRVEAGGESEAA